MRVRSDAPLVVMVFILGAWALFVIGLFTYALITVME